MPCSPPLTPPSQGGERDRSLARHSIERNKNAHLETVPSARSTPTFQHPSVGPLMTQPSAMTEGQGAHAPRSLERSATFLPQNLNHAQQFKPIAYLEAVRPGLRSAA